MAKHAQNPTPDLSGKSYFITGGTAGLGKEAVLALVQGGPQHVYFTGRNKTAATAMVEHIKSKLNFPNITYLHADMSSLRSVDELADEFLASHPRQLNTLMCNAGIMATTPSLSVDGYEMQFATNHLGHALLIRRLLPLLQQTAANSGDARIVTLSSIAHNMHPKSGIHFATLKTKQEDLGTAAGASWARYGQSKLANMLYADELARRYPEITSVSVHPGVVDTELVTKHLTWGKKLGLRMSNLGKKKMYAEEGSRNQVWAATAPHVESGAYYVPVGEKSKREKMGNDKGLGGKLWDWTAKELDTHGRH